MLTAYSAVDWLAANPLPFDLHTMGAGGVWGQGVVLGTPDAVAGGAVAPSSWADRWWYRDYLRRVMAGPHGRAGEGLIGTLAQRPTLTVFEGGSLVEARMPKIGVRGVVGSPRGVVGSFSAGSRRRLMRTVAKLRRDVLPVFVTLTYPGKWAPAGKVWKRDLASFWKRLTRAWPGASCVWRLEFQRRGAPHYHLLLYNVPLDGLLEKYADGSRWIDKNWYEVVGSGDLRHQAAGCRVESLRSLEGTFFYAAKYLSKDGLSNSGVLADGVGRFWGIMGRQYLPWAAKVVYIMLGSECWAIRRAIARVINIRPRGRKGLSAFGLPERWAVYLSRLRGVELANLVQTV